MRGLIVLAAVAGALLLGGCSAAPGSEPEEKQWTSTTESEDDPSDWTSFYAEEVPLPDGRTVICIIEFDNSGNFECDWDHAE